MPPPHTYLRTYAFALPSGLNILALVIHVLTPSLICLNGILEIAFSVSSKKGTSAFLHSLSLLSLQSSYLFGYCPLPSFECTSRYCIPSTVFNKYLLNESVEWIDLSFFMCTVNERAIWLEHLLPNWLPGLFLLIWLAKWASLSSYVSPSPSLWTKWPRLSESWCLHAGNSKQALFSRGHHSNAFSAPHS